MSFLLRCPQCGPRDVYEFRFGGEQSRRPAPDSTNETWADYLYFRRNEAGRQQEWWYHRAGCRRWFVAVRDTRVNQVERTFWFDDAGRSDMPGTEQSAPASSGAPRPEPNRPDSPAPGEMGGREP